MLIFDIGANLGNYTKVWRDKGTIISVEASPIIFRKLRRINRGHLNVICLNYAVCDSKKKIIGFFHCDVHTLSTSNLDWLTDTRSRFHDWPKKIHEIQVQTITMDTLISQYGMPDLVKIDVEGSECQVLQSLTQKTPMLCFEWTAEWRKENQLSIDHLTKIGFSKFHIQESSDEYSYIPTSFDLTSSQCKKLVIEGINKLDWGMVWAS